MLTQLSTKLTTFYSQNQVDVHISLYWLPSDCSNFGKEGNSGRLQGFNSPCVMY